MNQRLAWPVNLVPQEDGTILVSFPDIPEALTEGESEDEAIAQAQDCLTAALGGYVAARRAIPGPALAHGRPHDRTVGACGSKDRAVRRDAR